VSLCNGHRVLYDSADTRRGGASVEFRLRRLRPWHRWSCSAASTMPG